MKRWICDLPINTCNEPLPLFEKTLPGQLIMDENDCDVGGRFERWSDHHDLDNITSQMSLSQ